MTTNKNSLFMKMWPAYILRKETKPFDFENPPMDPVALADILKTTMVAKGGIGLAAPQMNFPYQVFVMGGEYSQEAVFNPQIVSESIEKETMLEGCLSFPGIYVEVERSKHIEVKYQDVTGAWQNFDVVDYDARVFLHEYDHLQGMTYNKRVSKLRWDRAKRQAKKEKLINTN